MWVNEIEELAKFLDPWAPTACLEDVVLIS